MAATAKASKTDAARRPKDRNNMNEVPKSGRDRGATIMAQAYAPTTRGFSKRFRFLQRRSRFRRPLPVARSCGCEKSGHGRPFRYSVTGSRAAAECHRRGSDHGRSHDCGHGWPFRCSVTGSRAAAGRRVEAPVMDDCITSESAPVVLPATRSAATRAGAMRTRGAAQRGRASPRCSRRPRGHRPRVRCAPRGCPARSW